MSFNFGSAMQTIFGSNPPAAQNPGTPKAPGNFPAAPSAAVDPNNPTVPVAITEPAAPASPLDQFKDIWNTDPNAQKQQAPMFANVDPAAIAAAAAKNDFTKVITPELQAAFAAGGPEAIAAATQMMQLMSQKSFGDSAVATTKIVESALAKQQEHFLAALPGIIKNQNLSENLRTTNPLFSNPAVAPMLEMMKNQVAAKHPTLSTAEQTKMAQDYVIAFAQVANPTKPSAQEAQAAGSTDFSNW